MRPVLPRPIHEIESDPSVLSGESREDSVAQEPSPATNGVNAAEAQPDASGPDANASDTHREAAIAKSFRGLGPIFRNRNFLTLWSGQVFSQIADKVYLVLMIAIISSQFEAPGQTISGWVSGIMIAFTIPAVLFGSLAGVYIDRWPKKPVLVLTNLIRGGLVAGLPGLLWLTQDSFTLAGLPIGFWILLIVTFFISTLTQFFAPAEQAALPLIVSQRNLLPANSLYTTTMMASVIVGFAVGEPLLAIADRLLVPLDGGSGVGKCVLVGVSYGVAGLLLLLLRTDETLSDVQEQAHVWQDIREGLAYLGRQAQVRSAVIQLVVLFSVFAALAVLAVRLAEVMPHLKSSQFGFLLAAAGVGMAIGAVSIGQFGQRFSRSVLGLGGSLGMAISLLGLSFFTQQLWPSLLLIGVLGLCAAIVGIPMQTTIQEKTPEEMRGKVFGLQNNVVNIALSLPLAVAGLAEAFLGLRVVFGLLAGLVTAGGLLTWSVANATATPDETAAKTAGTESAGGQ
ncbi:MFS transporter [Romeria aff. gracilis LEGE 07310]|uniref:MFS transporter n=1 Tax=Vasconcelosia minhoensis LEGE 07310 TaxID=915328 RepID=A0A8J7DA19_9CYAN|nr:MFS transporter [Romeria aff. gracilis LEGE 07310]